MDARRSDPTPVHTGSMGESMRKMLAASLAVALAGSTASAQQQIVNGGFETGDFTGWNVANQAGGSGDFYTSMGCTPLNCFTTNGPRSGSWYAVTDQTGPGAHEIWQSFTLSGAAASAIFKFSIADLNQASGTANFGDLDYTSVPNQHVRVDIFSGSYSPFATSSLQSFFTGATTELGGTGYIDFTFDVTSLLSAAGTYTVRFAEVDNQFFHNFSVDDVSLAVTATPEPASMTLLATGLVGIAVSARRRRKA
jgi:hypothetical protein